MSTIIAFEKNELAELVRLVADAQADVAMNQVTVPEMVAEKKLNETQQAWLLDYYAKRSSFLKGLSKKISDAV